MEFVVLKTLLQSIAISFHSIPVRQTSPSEEMTIMTNDDSYWQLKGSQWQQQATAFGWRNPMTMMMQPGSRAGATFPDITL